eukprot:1148767_1
MNSNSLFIRLAHIHEKLDLIRGRGGRNARSEHIIRSVHTSIDETFDLVTTLLNRYIESESEHVQALNGSHQNNVKQFSDDETPEFEDDDWGPPPEFEGYFPTRAKQMSNVTPEGHSPHITRFNTQSKEKEEEIICNAEEASVKPVSKEDVSVTPKQRLISIFGAPYALTSPPNNKWNNMLMMEVIKVNASYGYQAESTSNLVLDEETGCIALIEKDSSDLSCCVIQGAIQGEWEVILGRRSRVRFFNNHIYVLDVDRHSINVYRLNGSRIERARDLEDVISDSYFKEACIEDFVITNGLLIVLFGRWLGVYRLHPGHELEWYHAVAFKHKNPKGQSRIEMSISDESEEDEHVSINGYAFIHSDNKIIAVHPSNPTFAEVIVAENVNHKSFCTSRFYGVFYIGGTRQNRIYQSNCYDARNVQMICSLESSAQCKGFQMISMDKNNPIATNDILRFDDLVYDEHFGVSGRLLIQCIPRHAYIKELVTYQCFNLNELMLLKEYTIGVDGDRCVCMELIVEMLYGEGVLGTRYVEAEGCNVEGERGTTRGRRRGRGLNHQRERRYQYSAPQQQEFGFDNSPTRFRQFRGRGTRGRGRGRGRGNTQRGRGNAQRGRGRGHEFHKNKLSNVGRSKTHDPHTTPYKGKGKNRGRGRGRGRGKYANDTNYYKYNKPQFIGFYMTAIIDMSGSMANSRIKAATQGVQGLMGNLNDNDFVSILGFNSKMIKVLEPAPYGTVKDKIPNKLAECVNSVGGGTAMWDALNEAIERQKEFLKKDQNKSKSKRKQRIIVVTDGEDNSSQTSADHVIQEAAFFNLHGKKNFEFVLTVIAVGEAQQLPSLQKLCKPKHCHLVEVGDYNGIAKAIQNEWKRK